MKILINTAFLLALWGFHLPLMSQCNLPSDVNIIDKDTSVVSFLIEGAVINDLNLNSVCGVNINFSHDFIGDVSIILISPSGQEVTLVGPSVETSPNTQFTNWNVSFVPCSFQAIPDPGIAPKWNNLSGWFQFESYTGSYYPSIGCLEDLNSGTVNGTWSVKIIDAVSFGGGEIESINIVFCNPTGIDCGICIADPGEFVTPALSYCEGKQELSLVPAIAFFGNNPDPQEYTYRYLVFNGNSAISLADSIDLRNANPGMYQVCGLALNRSIENSLPSINGVSNKAEYQALLDASFACASLTPQCLNLTVEDVLDTIIIQESICSNSTFEIEGVTYDSPGEYIVSYSQNSCDSMTILQLSLFEIQSNITGNDRLLSCSENTLTLSGTGSIADDSISYNWSTIDGFIRTDTASTTIELSQEGRYFLEITSNGCKDTSFVDVSADDSFVEFDFVFDEINCLNESTLIDMTTNVTLTSVSWNGPIFSRVGDDIVASEPGVYYVNVVSEDGCSAMDSVRIIDGFDIEDPTFDNRDITCVNETVLPGASLSDTSGMIFQWIGPNGFSSNILNPEITVGGPYMLSINGDNGCTENFNLIINDARIFAQLTPISDTLTCDKTSLPLIINSSLSDVVYSWTGPGGYTSDQVSPAITLEGTYTATVTSSAQCSSTQSVTIEKDIFLPGLVANDVVIDCSDGGSVILKASSDVDNPEFEWTGPAGYIATGPTPVANIIGTYNVIVTGSNGCSRLQSLEVLPGTVPSVEFISDTIDCDLPITAIIPSDTSSFSYTYVSETNVVINDIIPSVGEAGEYDIRVIDTAGCYGDYVHEVLIDTITPTLALAAREIDCNNDSIQISLISDIPLRQNTWTGPFDFMSEVEDPYVSHEGRYTVNVIGVNGCINSRSIRVVENFNMPQISPRDTFFSCEETSIDIIADVDMLNSSFEWSGPNGFVSDQDTPTIVTDGLYFMNVTGPNGCKNNDTLEVVYDTIPPILTLVNDGFLTCPDPIVTLSSTINESNVSTFWLGPDTLIRGGTVIDVTTPGIWTLEVLDATNCISRIDVVVETEIIYPQVTVDYNDINCSVVFTNIIASTDEITDSTIWNGPILIGNNTENFTTNVEGIYSITAFGNNGCDTTVIFEVLKDTIPPDFDFQVPDTITCRNPQIPLIVNQIIPIDIYNWIGPQAFSSSESQPLVSSAGLYILQATGVNGCLGVDTISVAIDTLSPFVESIDTSVNCASSKARLDVLTNAINPRYTWTGPGNYSSSEKNPIAVVPGTYFISVASRNGCSSSDSLILQNDNTPPRIEIDEISYLLCDSSGINLEIVSDNLSTKYQWIGPNGYYSEEQRPFVDTIGTYEVTAIGENGCRTSDSTRVIVDTRLPQFEISGQDINCVEAEGLIITQFLEDDRQFMWSGPNGFSSTETTFSVLDSGLYTIIVQGNNLCIDTQAVYIAIDRVIPIASAVFDELLQCEVTEVRINGTGSVGAHSLSYMWTTVDGEILNGETTDSPLVGSAGTYQLHVVDNINKCDANSSVEVVRTEQEFLDFDATLSDPSCVGLINGEIDVNVFSGGYGPYVMSFGGGAFARKNVFPFLDAGTYTIAIKDSLGCFLEKEFTLNGPKAIDLALGRDTLIDLGDSLDIIAITNLGDDEISQMTWTPSDIINCGECFTQNVRPLVSTYFTLMIEDQNGCTSVDDILIRVKEQPEIEMPNIFKPTSDGGNEIFYLPQTKGIEQINYMSIYDRWGNRLFHRENFMSGDKSNGWDGYFRNEIVTPAVFVVVTEFTLLNGLVVYIESDLTLIR